MGYTVCPCFSPSLCVCLTMAAILSTPSYLKPTQSNIKLFETHKRLVYCYSSIRFPKFVPLAAESEEATPTTTHVEETQPQVPDTEEKPPSAVSGSLRLYKEALASNDAPKIVEIEAFLQCLYEEKRVLENKVVALSIEVALEKDRRLGINADFYNFRNSVESERLSLATDVREEVAESLSPVLDSFERAMSEIKVETDGEKMINNSYQSIFKQYLEISESLGVVPVDTSGSRCETPAKYQVDSKLYRLLEDFFQAFGRVHSGFMKKWIQF